MMDRSLFNDWDTENRQDPIVLMSDHFLTISKPDDEPVIFEAIRQGDELRIQSLIHHHDATLNEKFEGGSYSVQTNTMAHQVMLSGYCVIHVAALHSTIEVIETLIKSGADKDALDKQQRTPMHLAAIAGRIAVIRLLIQNGAMLDVQSSSGRTPLLEAIFNNDFVVARVLIEAGANIDLRDTKGTSVLHHMCLSRRPNTNFLEYILSKKCDVNITNSKGSTPLMFACTLKTHFSSGIVRMFLAHGANINQTDKDGYSAIHFVVEYKTAFEKTGVILLFLIQHGASTNIVDKKGRTLLDFPMKNMSIGAMKCLLLSDCKRDSLQIMENPQVVFLCDNVPGFKDWLTEELYSPRSLMRLCRQTLRSSLSPDGLTQVDQLDIPKHLQDFILCKDIQMHHLVT